MTLDKTNSKTKSLSLKRQQKKLPSSAIVRTGKGHVKEVKDFPHMKGVKVVRQQENEAFQASQLPDLNITSAVKDRTNITTESVATAESFADDKHARGKTKADLEHKSGSARSEKSMKGSSFKLILVVFMVPVIIVIVALTVYFATGGLTEISTSAKATTITNSYYIDTQSSPVATNQTEDNSLNDTRSTDDNFFILPEGETEV